MKKLPLGIQTFSQIIEEDYLYVDKTKYLYEIVKKGKSYFLSRPRRFGKSLIVSTLKEIFKGNKKLFEGLYIYDKWNWNEKYPVIHLDLSKVINKNVELLEARLIKVIEGIALSFSINLNNIDSQGMLDELITKLYDSFNQKVVILIDEYDTPLIDNMEDNEVFDTNREFLNSFYKVLKSNDEYLKFIFLTGVSKFSNVSIFSGLNSPRDISLSKDFVTICGYTQNELEKYFKDYIKLIANEESITYDEALNDIKCWYDGYSWNGKDNVYNPYSTLSMFLDEEFGSYWFQTGTTTFLMEKLKKNNNLIPIINPNPHNKIDLMNFEIGNTDMIPLLFQTGYLTIKSVEKYDREKNYILSFPNKEVKDSFGKYLLNAYTNYSNGELNSLKRTILKQIHSLDNEGLNKSFEILLSQIPYQLHIPQESYYHSLYIAWLFAHGFNIRGEESISDGRIDATLEEKDTVVIAEFKHSTEKEENGKIIKAKSLPTLLDEAINQIYEKKYYKNYYNKNKIILLGVAVSNKKIANRIELLKKD
ncbi:MAG: AAA family ATPase [Methanobrevibacter sp.]|nr:AAA family ATPase [Methanobrevibacter sp.]